MTPQQLVDEARQSPQFKYKYKDWDDFDIYEDLKKKYSDIDFPDYNPTKIKSTSLMDADTSPGILEWLGTANIATIGAEADGPNEDFWKDAYNKSMAGLIYKSIHGEDRYEFEDYEPGYMAQAGQFFVGMISPLEIATFAGGGIAGKAVAGQVSKLALRGLKNGIVKKSMTKTGVQTGKHLAHNIATQATEMGVAGGMFSAAHGAAHSAAEQKEKYGSVDAGQIILDGVKAGLSSMPLYMATGGVAGGLMKTLNNFATLPQYSGAVFGAKVNKLLTGTVPQVGAEAALFTTLPMVMDSSEEEYGGGRWFGEFAKNLMIIGGMRTGMRLWKGYEPEVEMMKLLDTELKLNSSSLKKEAQALKNAKDSIEDIADIVPKQEILRKIVEKESSIQSIAKELKLTKTKSKKLVELLGKIDDVEFLEKLRKGDVETLKDVEFIIKEGSFLNLATNGLIDKIINDPAKLEAHFKSQFPNREVNETNLSVFKDGLKNYSKNIDSYFDKMNRAILGTDITKTTEGAKPLEDVVIEPTVLGREKKEYLVGWNKKQLINKYNQSVDEFITRKFGTDYPAKKRENIKKSLAIDETLKKNQIVDEMFGLKDRIDKFTAGTPEAVAVAEVGTAVQNIKGQVKSVKEMQQGLKQGSEGTQEGLFWTGIGGRHAKRIIEFSKEVNEQSSIIKLDKKQTKIYNENKNIVQHILQNDYKLAGGGPGGRGAGALTKKSIADKLEALNQLNSFASSRNKKLFELNKNDFTAFLIGRTDKLTVSTVNDLLRVYGKNFVDTELALMTPEQIAGLAKERVLETYGFKTDYIIDVANKPRSGIDITAGKVSKEKAVPVTETLWSKMISMITGNRKKGISLRVKEEGAAWEGGKRVDVYHEFGFLDIVGAPIHSKRARIILEKLMGTKIFEKMVGKGRMDALRKPGAFRKSFVSWVEAKYGSTLGKLADQYMLGHTRGQVQEAYFKASKASKNKLMKALNEYSEIIRGKRKTKKEIGDAENITPYEISQLYKSINELVGINPRTGAIDVNIGNNIKIGNQLITPETLKNLLLYSAESGSRPSEILPTKGHLKDIGFEKAFKDFKPKPPKDTGPPKGGAGGGGGKDITLPDFSQSSVKRVKETINKTFGALFEKIGITGKNYAKDRQAIKEWVYKATFGLDSKAAKGYKLGEEIDFVSDAQLIFEKIVKLDPGIAKRIPAEKTFFGTFARITKPNGLKDRMNIKDETQLQVLRDLGVKMRKNASAEEALLNAELHQIKTYESILFSMESNKMAPVSWLQDALLTGMTKMEIKKKMNSVLEMKKAVMPVHMVMESIGLHKLANSLFGHTAAELNHTGAMHTFESIGKGKYGNRTFNKWKEYITLFDKEQYFDYFKENALNSKEIGFIKKAFDYDIKTGKWEIRNTKEGEFVNIYKEFMRYYPKAVKAALKRNVTEAEYERFEKGGYFKWLGEEKNIYVTRRVTKEFKDAADLEGNFYRKEVQFQTLHIAKKIAMERYNEPVPSKKQINEFMEEANILAVEELHTIFEFNAGKFSSSFMKPRYVKLPAFVNIKGKRIQVYERSYSKTVNKYAHGMGKFIANLEYFPEYVALKGFKFPGRKKNIAELDAIDPSIGKWANKMVKRHLGIERPETDFPVAAGWLQKYTGTLAKLQLSFFPSGLKNLIVGNVQTTLAFLPKHFLGGIFDSIAADNRRMVRSMSAHELGMRHFDTGATHKILDKYVFRLGLMKPTEKINRYVSVLASMREQKELGRILTHAEPTSKKYKKAYKKLTDFYKLSDRQINLIKKYGVSSDQIDIKQFKDKFEGGKVIREVELIQQQMSTMAHINTQGASIDIFMPGWAENPVAKSALLYKRMAYAASVNTLRNVNVAWQTGSPLSFAMFGLGTYYGGETLIHVYDKVLGQTMPTQNSSWGKQFTTTLWKGEFMGLASEFMSPYFGRENMSFASKPAVMSSMELMYGTISNIWKKDKFWLEGEPSAIGAGQQLRELITGHVGFINGTIKAIERGKPFSEGHYYKNVSRFKKLHNVFVREMNKEKLYQPNSDLFAQFEKSKYMEAFYKMFHAGSEKEFHRWYNLAFFAKAQDYFMEGRAPGIVNGKSVFLPVRSRGEALKLARTEMQKSLERLNPIREIIDPKTGKTDITGRRQYRYFQWLARDEFAALKKANPNASEKLLWKKSFEKSELVQDLVKTANEYRYKVRQLKLNWNKYNKGLNIERLLQQFGINKLL